MKYIRALYMIFILNINLQFGGGNSKKFEDYQIVYPTKVENESFLKHFPLYKRTNQLKSERDTTVHYKVKIDGKDEFIDLFPNSNICAPDTVIETKMTDRPELNQLNGIQIRRLTCQPCLYTGKIRNYKDSSAALSTFRGLSGFVRINQSTYFIEPSSIKESDSLKQQAHILYRHRSKSSQPNCAVADEINLQDRGDMVLNEKSRIVNEIPMSAERNNSLNIETTIVADKSMINNYLPEQLEYQILTALNMAQSIFSDVDIEPSINLNLIRLILLQDDNDEINKKSELSAEEDMKSFSEWQNLINPTDDNNPYHHDIAVLLTRRNICDGNNNCHYCGIAETNGICRPNRQAAICKDTSLLLGYTLAHEIAHTLGLEHDSKTIKRSGNERLNESPNMMDPRITLNSRGWSDSSRDKILTSLKRGSLNCLKDKPTIISHQTNDILPGIIYNAKYQCQRILNHKASDCNIEENCSSLKCRFEGASCTNTGVRPAEGTACGQNKWCNDGECLDIGEQPLAVDGGWSRWSNWSPCSRSCDIGVSVSTRECNNPQPKHGGKLCSGKDKIHKICSTEPCPKGSLSFRDLQCARYNNWIFPEDGKTHEWKSYFINSGNPCTLFCKNEKNIVAPLSATVIDGTTCYRERRDICIDGICKNIPCDLHFDSGSVEDGCGICHGNGTSCKVIRSVMNTANKGLEELITSVPFGTRNLKVEATESSNSHFIVKSVNGSEVYNNRDELGLFRVPGSAGWIGMTKPNQEILEIPGPISEPLNILLWSSGPQTVHYSMGLPDTSQKGNYIWDNTDWLPCKAQCGEGFQESDLKCIEVMSGQVEDDYCKGFEKPKIKTRSCNAGPCYPRWLVGEWFECGPCPSSYAKRFRTVQCVKPVFGEENGKTVVQDNECAGSRPVSSEHCQCLKRQAGYWPPHYRSHYPRDYRIFLKTYKIRKVRSTVGVPEKKVTLMQLENENEEAMLNQFKENQQKQQPFLYIPNLFGTKFKFTIPIRKRQDIWPLKNDPVNKNLLNSLNKLEKYFRNLLLSQRDVSTTVENLAYFSPTLHDPIPTYVKPEFENEYLNKSDPTNEIPLRFSDNKILKLLSDNLQLHKLQHNQCLKRKYEIPGEKHYRENNFGGSKDFLGSVGMKLYQALKTQSYLETLLNNSLNLNENVLFKRICNNKKDIEFPIETYNIMIPFIEKSSTKKKIDNDVDFTNLPRRYKTESFDYRKPMKVLHNHAMTIEHLPQIDNFNNIFMAHLNNSKIYNVSKPLIKQAEKNYINTDDKEPNWFRKDNYSSDTFFPISESENESEKPSERIAAYKYLRQEDQNEESFLVQKIFTQLRNLSYVDKLRLYDDLIGAIEYLSTLLSARGNNENRQNNYIRKRDIYNLLFPLLAKDVANVIKHRSLGINENTDSNNILTSLNDTLMRVSQSVRRNSKNKTVRVPNRKNKRESKTQREDIDKNEIIKTLKIMQGRIQNEVAAELVGALTYPYPIPEGRKCTTTTIATNCYAPNCKRDLRNIFSMVCPFSDVTKNVNIPTDVFQPNDYQITLLDSHNNRIKIFNCQKKDDDTYQCEGPKESIDSSNKYSIENINDVLQNINSSEVVSIKTTTDVATNVTTNDPFFSPPGYDDVVIPDVSKCHHNPLIALQRELQLARTRNCTGCYYIYKDETTRPAKC